MYKRITNEQPVSIGFLRAILEEHEEELDQVLTKLKEVTTELGENEKLIGDRLEEIDQRLKDLQSEISNLAKCHVISKQSQHSY